MNILVIGNGFDLAHELPTQYADFLKFCKMINIIYNPLKDITMEALEAHLKFNEINEEVGNRLKRVLESRIKDKNTDKGNYVKTESNIMNELYEQIAKNLWIKYFSEHASNKGENWTGFEGEISNLIKSLDDDLYSLNGKHDLSDKVEKLTNTFLKKQYIYSNNENTYKKIRDELLNDLNKLIRAFEIYLVEYIEKIDIKKKSPNIEKIIKEINQNRDKICILSFNYTHIIKRIYLDQYGDDLIKDIDYIHGEADIMNLVETNNMVLGIDEYLSKKRKNKAVEFIAFKKYYQRIHKQTGCKYKEWVDEIKDGYIEYYNKKHNAGENILESIREGNNYRFVSEKEYITICEEGYPEHNLYIFGHSLDETDGDILRDLILNDNVNTTIFYKDKDVYGQQIANLVKVIGQDELIRRTGGKRKTIKFELQRPMRLLEEQ